MHRNQRATTVLNRCIHCKRAAAPSSAHNRYGDLLTSSRSLAEQIVPALAPKLPGASAGPRIGIYSEPGFPYVASTWAAWAAGGVAVPLATSHPPAEIDYVIRDAGISTVCAAPEIAGVAVWELSVLASNGLQ